MINQDPTNFTIVPSGQTYPPRQYLPSVAQTASVLTRRLSLPTPQVPTVSFSSTPPVQAPLNVPGAAPTSAPQSASALSNPFSRGPMPGVQSTAPTGILPSIGPPSPPAASTADIGRAPTTLYGRPPPALTRTLPTLVAPTALPPPPSGEAPFKPTPTLPTLMEDDTDVPPPPRSAIPAVNHDPFDPNDVDWNDPVAAKAAKAALVQNHRRIFGEDSFL